MGNPLCSAVGHARISRPESGGDCYFSAKWGQLAVHHYRVELSGDSPTRGRAMSALPPWVQPIDATPSNLA